MPTSRTSAVVALLASLASLAGCSHSSGNATDPDAGADAQDDVQVVTCQKDPRALTYSANMTVAGALGMFKIVLVASDPAPPSRGTNTWTIKVLDATGNPAGAPTVDVKPFMPDHGHGTSIRADATPAAGGVFSVAPLYLFMPGLWQVTFTVKDGATTDTVVFSFCVAG